MTVAEKVRERVQESYGAAVREGGSCCGDVVEEEKERACCADAIPKGVAAKTAGYSEEELGSLPSAAVVNSFGCGNPLAFSEVQPGQTVLDLGSGAGIDLLLAAGRVGPSGKVIGVDMTDEMIARARESVAKARLSQVEVRKGLIEELPVESGTVDWVISNCVINLSPEKDKVFSEMARVLKPGGRISISDIVVERMPWWVRRSARLHCACVAGAISEADYVAGLERAGLVDIAVTERLVYERSQIESLVRSEVATISLPRWLRGAAGGLVARLAGGFAGRVWSAKFVGASPSPN
jgi:SAM-dependent methyltransferase